MATGAIKDCGELVPNTMVGDALLNNIQNL